MSIQVYKDKEINKIINMLENNHNVIKDAYEVLTGEELQEKILDEINIYNTEKVIVNKETIRYFLGISFYTYKNYISIQDAAIDYNIKNKNIELNTNFLAFMDINIQD